MNIKFTHLLLAVLIVLFNGLDAQVPADSLVAYWPFNGNTSDESGNGYDGINHGATPTSDRFGNPNSAYRFDGNDYIIVPDFGDSIPLTEISVSLWIKTKTQRSQFQLMLCPDVNRFAVAIDYSHNGINSMFWDFGWDHSGGEPPGRLYSIGYPLSKDWHQYVLVSSHENDTMIIYKDGEVYVSDTEARELLNAGGRDLKIGSGDGELYYQGIIDDIRIYSRVLNPDEIASLYVEDCPVYEVNDTLVYHVSDSIFQYVGPRIFMIATDSLVIKAGCCDSLVNRYEKYIFDSRHYTDTLTFNDTITIVDSISVTDTLVIDVVLNNLPEPGNINRLKIYPNPSREFMIINNGNYSMMEDYSLLIINTLGQAVFDKNINKEEFQIDADELGGRGTYLIHIRDGSGNVLEVRKLILL